MPNKTLPRREFLAATAAAVVLPQFLRGAEGAERKFKLGLVTYNVPANWDLPTILKTCQTVGIAAVECRTTHKHGVEPKLNAEQRKTVKKQFADAGVVFWGCGSVCEFHSDDPAVVKKNVADCLEFIDLVKDLGGTGVKVRPNGVAKGSSQEQACEQIGKALRECGKTAADAGVEIWVEVHGAVTQLPKNMKAIMEACGQSSVGVTWNSNPTDLTDGKIDEAFKLLEPWIKSCHINDLGNDKAGKYPYRELFRKLREMKYDRYTMCEVGKTYEPEAGLEYLKDYAKQWEELSK
jgi:sugar phosphate isomerase/epimerase